MPIVNLTDAELAIDQPIKATHMKVLRDGVNQLGAGGGAVGSYAIAYYTGANVVYFGQSVSGTLLVPASAAGVGSGTLSGGWLCHGHVDGASPTAAGRTTLWLRVS